MTEHGRRVENVMAMAMVDLDGTILFLNRPWVERHGYSMADLPRLVGQPMGMFHTPSQRDQELKPFLDRGLETGFQQGRVAHLHRERSTFTTWTTLNLLFHETGQPSALVMTLEEPGEYGDVAMALKASEARYRRLVEHAADAFFLHDLEARIIDVNQSACDSLGYSRQELLRLTLVDIDEVFEIERAREIWAQMKPGVPFTFENRHRRKDGTTFPVEVRLGRFEAEGRPL
ncbi:MAG: PAS domain-containing protein, partial [Acidobacteriota bacterium]